MNPLLNESVSKTNFQHEGWNFCFQKAIITKSKEIDDKSSELSIQHCPEQVFGSNIVFLHHQPSSFKLMFDPWDSLSFCNYEKAKQHNVSTEYQASKEFSSVNFIENQIKVKHSAIWKEKKLNEIPDVKEMEKISDPFFCTPYKGTIIPSENSFLETTNEGIPLSNLTPANPIQWHEQIILWEDELGDNGISTCDFRFRVMKDCFFGLLRHYLRVDDVAIRITDTRFYHEFKWKYILREHCVKEETYENIAKKGFNFSTDWMSNPNQSFIISDFLTQVFVSKDKVFL